MAAPTNVYSVNYYPINDAGFSMWESANYPSNAAQYQADMVTAKSLGFNTLRIFLAASNGVFDFPSPTSTELGYLTDFCNRAATVGIKLHVTLFDAFGYSGQAGTYGQINGAKTWATAIVKALVLSQVGAIELQNETQFSKTASYNGTFDTGYPGYPPGPTSPLYGQVAIQWAELMIPFLKTLAPSIPILTSCTDYGSGQADLAVLYNAVNGTGNAPDWYEWHCYVSSAAAILNQLTLAQAITGNSNLYIGEMGLQPGDIAGDTASMKLQANHLETVRVSCHQLGLPEPAPWMLFDCNDSAQFSGGQTYGLFDVNGTIKPSGQLYASNPPGSLVTARFVSNGSTRSRLPAVMT